jgi:hypothetical protein
MRAHNATVMSTQLRLAAGFSVIAMAALALLQGEGAAVRIVPMETGATVEAAAPEATSLPGWASFIR